MKTRNANRLVWPKNARHSLHWRSLALFVLFAILLLPSQLLSQTEPSALVDFQSTEKGFLLPRMTQAERNAITSPAKGLMIYNTTANCLQINDGSPSVPVWISLGFIGSVGTLNCNGATLAGNVIRGVAANGVSVSVPYTGGNGGAYSGQTVSSTGVTGLTATLAAGTFSTGTGNLVYTISGIPDTSGTASFALVSGGQNCAFNLAVAACGAYVAPSVWKGFMCHNLGAENMAADPFMPSWEITGGYWQWGRPAMAAPGPWGPDISQANEGAIFGWNTSTASNSAWSDAKKTSRDPCPAGFRLPTKAQWDGVLANNTQSITGIWAGSPINYSSGRLFGPYLMLPAAGLRSNNSGGALFSRGDFGLYWSSTEDGVGSAWNLVFTSGGAFMDISGRRDGFSIRCIAE